MDIAFKPSICRDGVCWRLGTGFVLKSIRRLTTLWIFRDALKCFLTAQMHRLEAPMMEPCVVVAKAASHS